MGINESLLSYEQQAEAIDRLTAEVSKLKRYIEAQQVLCRLLRLHSNYNDERTALSAEGSEKDAVSKH